jgi:hypothetical protein
MNKHIMQNQSGVSLVMAIVIGLLLSIVSYVTMNLVIGDSRVSTNQLANSQAFWLAEGGLEMAYHWLRFQNPPPGGTAPFSQYNQMNAGAGTYSVTIDPDDDNVSTYLKAYTITATGSVAGIDRKLSIHVGMTTFGRYAYLTGDEGSGIIWFTSNDLIEGAMHSNDQIAITGSPTFMGKVTSTSNSFYQGNPFAPNFQQGYQLGVPPVTFPTLQDLINNYYASNNDQSPQLVIDARFSKDAEVVFNSDGTITYSVWHYSGGTKIWDVAPTTAGLSSLNGLIYVNGDVRVKGQVNGQITLIATKEIYITDDILYIDSNANGTLAPGTTNSLGLISNDDIVVSNTTANQSNCRINGALLALGTSFTVENYSSGSPRGTLTIYGSLSQSVRGPVGTFGGGGTQTGYNKDYHYDNRFIDTPPPYFPVTGQYAMYSWHDENQ